MHAVDSLNAKNVIRSEKVKELCIMQTFPNNISWFAMKFALNFLHKLKQRLVTSLDGFNGRSIQMLLRE